MAYKLLITTTCGLLACAACEKRPQQAPAPEPRSDIAAPMQAAEGPAAVSSPVSATAVCATVEQAVNRCLAADPTDPKSIRAQWVGNALVNSTESPMKERCPTLAAKAITVLSGCDRAPCAELNSCIWEADLVNRIQGLPAFDATSPCAKIHERVASCFSELPNHEVRGELASAWGCDVCARQECAALDEKTARYLEGCAGKPCPDLASCVRRAWLQKVADALLVSAGEDVCGQIRRKIVGCLEEADPGLWDFAIRDWKSATGGNCPSMPSSYQEALPLCLALPCWSSSARESSARAPTGTFLDCISKPTDYRKRVCNYEGTPLEECFECPGDNRCPP